MTAPITFENGIAIGPGVSIGDFPAYNSFTLTSSDFVYSYSYNTDSNGVQYPQPQGTGGRDGFILNLSAIPPMYGNLQFVAFDPYQASNFSTGNGPAIYELFNNLTNTGVIQNYYSSIWSVTWAAGSTITQGYAILGGSPGGSASNMFLLIAPVDTSVPGWNTNPPNNGSTPALAGTYLFPATFTLVQPVTNKGGWC